MKFRVLPFVSTLLVSACTSTTDDEAPSPPEESAPDLPPDLESVATMDGGQTGDEGNMEDTPCLRPERLVFFATIREVNEHCSVIELGDPLSEGARSSALLPGQTLVGHLRPFFLTTEKYEALSGGDEVFLDFGAVPIGDVDGMLRVAPHQDGELSIYWQGASYPFTAEELLLPECLERLRQLPDLSQDAPPQDSPPIAVFGDCEPD